MKHKHFVLLVTSNLFCSSVKACSRYAGLSPWTAASLCWCLAVWLFFLWKTGGPAMWTCCDSGSSGLSQDLLASVAILTWNTRFTFLSFSTFYFIFLALFSRFVFLKLDVPNIFLRNWNHLSPFSHDVTFCILCHNFVLILIFRTQKEIRDHFIKSMIKSLVYNCFLFWEYCFLQFTSRRQSKLYIIKRSSKKLTKWAKMVATMSKDRPLATQL